MRLRLKNRCRVLHVGTTIMVEVISTRHWPDGGTMLGQRRRPTSCQHRIIVLCPHHCGDPVY